MKSSLESVLISSALLLGLSATAVVASGFCYHKEECGPDHWGGSCLTGSHQSPIDIPLAKACEDRELLMNHCYSQHQSFILVNNGHSVQASLRADQTSSCVAGGSLLGENYVFSNIHFHWGSNDNEGSEHTVNGQSYAMEGHLVHYKAKFGNLSEALASGEKNALTVLGIFFTPSAYSNEALGPIIEGMRKIGISKSETSGANLHLASFFNFRHPEIFQYDGSLTTPNCNEAVLWNVVAKPAPISEHQLAAFRDLLQDEEGERLVNNFRPVQKLNGREIRYYQTNIQ